MIGKSLQTTQEHRSNSLGIQQPSPSASRYRPPRSASLPSRHRSASPISRVARLFPHALPPSRRGPPSFPRALPPWRRTGIPPPSRPPAVAPSISPTVPPLHRASLAAHPSALPAPQMPLLPQEEADLEGEDAGGEGEPASGGAQWATPSNPTGAPPRLAAPRSCRGAGRNPRSRPVAHLRRGRSSPTRSCRMGGGSRC